MFGDRFFWNLNSNHEIEQLVLPDKIALSPYPLKRYLNILSDGHGHQYASMNGVDAGMIQSLEAQYPLVVDNGTEIPELIVTLPVRLIGFNKLCNDPEGKLCCQPEFFPYLYTSMKNVLLASS